MVSTLKDRGEDKEKKTIWFQLKRKTNGGTFLLVWSPKPTESTWDPNIRIRSRENQSVVSDSTTPSRWTRKAKNRNSLF